MAAGTALNERGQVLFEIAPLDSYRLVVQVDERDIAGVAVGQHGRLTLSGLPGEVEGWELRGAVLACAHLPHG